MPLLWRRSTWKGSREGREKGRKGWETKETPAFQPANISRERKQSSNHSIVEIEGKGLDVPVGARRIELRVFV